MADVNLLVNIDVDDLGRGVDFYTRAFDLKVTRRFGSGGVELTGGSAPICLLVKPAGSQAAGNPAATRHYDRHWTPVHLDFVVENVEESVRRALQAGAVLERDVQVDVWGKIALLADPFGNGFCILQFIGRGYDEIAPRGDGQNVGRLPE